jgi:hypothetical protein
MGVQHEDAQEERFADEALPRLHEAVRVAQEMGARLGERSLLLEEMRRNAISWIVRFDREGGTRRLPLA